MFFWEGDSALALERWEMKGGSRRNLRYGYLVRFLGQVGLRIFFSTKVSF